MGTYLQGCVLMNDENWFGIKPGRAECSRVITHFVISSLFLPPGLYS